MEDNQIIGKPNKLPICSNPKCKREWDKGTPFVFIGDKYYCGECVIKFSSSYNKWLQEKAEELING